MTSIYEIDWRLNSTERILANLGNAITDLVQELDELDEQYQIDDTLELIENCLGIAFVIAQHYIIGTVSDANRIIKSHNILTKESLLRMCDDRISSSEITRMELCDAMANYYKHHEEWGKWAEAGRHQRTVSVLNSAGIKEKDIFPCGEAFALLWPGARESNLNPFVQLITSWRARVIDTCAQK